jgi:hypothetical protein
MKSGTGILPVCVARSTAQGRLPTSCHSRSALVTPAEAGVRKSAEESGLMREVSLSGESRNQRFLPSAGSLDSCLRRNDRVVERASVSTPVPWRFVQ